MSRPMVYQKTLLRGSPSSDAVFYRYEQIGYLKGILNYSSGKSIQDYVADALNSLTLEQIPTLQEDVQEVAKQIADEEMHDYIETDEFIERVVPIVVDNLVTTF